MNRWASGIALLFLAACNPDAPPPSPARPVEKPVAESKPAVTPAKKVPVDKKGRSKSPELFRKYMEIMEENGEILESIEKDVEEKKGDAVIKPKVLKLIKNGEAAKALQYRKDPDQQRELDDDFDLFLFKMKDLEKAAWDADGGKELHEKLGGRCVVCHDKFQ